ncbi:MAG: hypothetical protein ACRDTJ_26205, partial [Pseudonocardiaceae bacterium]
LPGRPPDGPDPAGQSWSPDRSPRVDPTGSSWLPDREPLWDLQHAHQRPLEPDPDRMRRRNARRAVQRPSGIDRAPDAPKPLARTHALAPWAILVVLAFVVLVAVIALLPVMALLPAALVRIGAGLAIAGGALAVAHQIRRHWTSRAPEAERKAATILFGAGQRDELTRSLMIEVDQVVRNLKSFDAKFLGVTVVAMIREYEEARESSERQAALLNVVVLMEKLQARFSPWHVRHKDAIATGVAVVGALVGVAGVISGFLAR